MEWVRGESIGRGSFGTVNLAKPRCRNSSISPLMAVKSSAVSHSASLMHEKLILDKLKGSPEIVRCLGDDFSVENGEKLYNVFLEFASGGNLAGKLRLPEIEVRRHTKSVLRGLKFIHETGFVHCDIKLQNILMFDNDGGDFVKIADFGLAKMAGERREKVGFEVRGTPLYMSPETVTGGEQESPADIWALGCAVVEMVTGAPAWPCRPAAGAGELLMRIGVGSEVPEIPGKLSEEGKDFLGKCFLKDPKERWTAEMLLNHPFVVSDDDIAGDPTTSPRCHFDFPDWESDSLSSPEPEPAPVPESEFSFQMELGFLNGSAAERLRELVTDQVPDWSDSGSWVSVRE